jgi:hypothetical protein
LIKLSIALLNKHLIEVDKEQINLEDYINRDGTFDVERFSEFLSILNTISIEAERDKQKIINIMMKNYLGEFRDLFNVIISDYDWYSRNIEVDQKQGDNICIRIQKI